MFPGFTALFWLQLLGGTCGRWRAEVRGEVISPTHSLPPDASPTIILSSSLEALVLDSNNLPLPCMSPVLEQGEGPVTVHLWVFSVSLFRFSSAFDITSLY